MNIVWLESGLVTESAQGPSSPHAGVRYRALPAMRAMSELGHAARIVPVFAFASVDELFAGDVDLLVCSRVVPPAPGAFVETANRYIACAQRARSSGIGVVVDANDRHWEVPESRAMLQQLMAQAGVVVAGSTSLAALLGGMTRAAIRVIGDPYELAEGAPQFAPPGSKRAFALSGLLGRLAGTRSPGRPVQLLWFGHPTNLGPILALVPQLSPLIGDWSIALHIVSAAGCGAEEVCEEVSGNFSPQLSARFTEWSPAAVAAALEACDLVVIPSEVDAPANLGKTANRMIESIRRGRFAVANPLPSYVEFERYAWVGDSLTEGIAWALRHPGAVRRRIVHGQEHVARHHSPQAIGRLWEGAMLDAARLARTA